MKLALALALLPGVSAQQQHMLGAQGPTIALARSARFDPRAGPLSDAERLAAARTLDRKLSLGQMQGDRREAGLQAVAREQQEGLRVRSSRRRRTRRRRGSRFRGEGEGADPEARTAINVSSLFVSVGDEVDDAAVGSMDRVRYKSRGPLRAPPFVSRARR